MRRAVLPLLVLLVGAAHAAGDAGPALIAEARLVPGGLEVMVANPRPAAVAAVVPEVVYQHRTLTGAPASIAPTERHTWRIALPPPGGPGAAAAVVRVRAPGLAEAAAAPVLVALVATPGTTPADVRMTFEAAPVARMGRAEVRLANPGAVPVDGRVVFVLPEGLATDPQTRPARLEAGGTATVTLGIENRPPLPPGTYAVYALFEYMEGDAQQTAMAKGLVTVAAPAGSEWRPLAVGGLALLAAVGLLVVALRRSARRPGVRAAVALLVAAAVCDARAATPADPIRPTFAEGDLSGVTDISDPVTGSSDEDYAEAHADGTLAVLGGRSVIRDRDGVAVPEVAIDAAGGRISGS